jgi:hypothetical protein
LALQPRDEVSTIGTEEKYSNRPVQSRQRRSDQS